jgi:polysaccharide biosynthesis protein PslH
VRVLILAPRAPYPPNSGAAQRNLNLLRWLGARHELTLLAFGDPEDTEAIRVLKEHSAAAVIVPPPRRSLAMRLGDLIGSRPDLARRLWSPDLGAHLAGILKREAFDVVQIEGLEMASAWEMAGGRQGVKTRVVLDAHNAEYVLQQTAARASLGRGEVVGGAYSLVQARRLRRYERDVARAVDGVVAVSREDEAALRALDPGIRTTVVTNGVDTEYYRPGARHADGEAVLFLGKLDYRPNVDAVQWLADEIWPRVLAARPMARLLLVGRDPSPRLARLANRPGIELIGPVPDERPWFDRADLLVVPMRMGGGVRLKVVQAMAMGVPVVATPWGVAGMDVRDGVHYLRGETAAALAVQVVRALGDAALRGALSDAGRKLVSEQYDWRVVLPRLDAFYEELVGTSRVRSD